MEYIIYVRKSTDEHSEHQKQSIPDQIEACYNYAINNWLKIKKRPKNFSDFETKNDLIIENKEKSEKNKELYNLSKEYFIVRERESAKEPFKRKKWRKIIEYIQKEEIKWVISYSPDRQARNLLEAWELIDLVDKWLVDLKYPNFHFEPNASGKMMLWIWFVFSKQYSDKLSEDITRWNLSALYNWKALWVYKRWYKINKDWYHEPDWNNFYLLREAFNLKIYENKSNEFIADYLNKKWFYKLTKNNKKEKVTAKRLSDIFKDTFYYWIFIYWEHDVDLIGVSNYYEPLITKDEYTILTEKIIKKKKDHSIEWKKYSELEPFPEWFIITEDWQKCSFYIAKKKQWQEKLEKEKKINPNISLADIVPKKYLYYKVSSKSKFFWKEVNWIKLKNIKAEIFERLIIKNLKNINISEETYEQYKIAFLKKLEQKEEENKHKRKVLQLQINNLRSKLDKLLVNKLYENLDDEEANKYKQERENLEDSIAYYEAELSKLNNSIRDKVLEIEVFFDLLKKAPEIYQKASIVRKRKIIKILFSNLIIWGNWAYLVVKPELKDIFTHLVDLTGIEPVYRSKAV